MPCGREDGMPKQSLSEVYLHFVWSTYRRMPVLEEAIQPQIYAAILREVQRSGCSVLAIGGVEDHVHVVVQMSPTISASALAKRMKGVTSYLARGELGKGRSFRWETGYGVFSFSRSHRERVIGYVRRQKEHHTRGDLWRQWEQSEMEA
jgi:REP element-mobilizing transposase RayT